MLRPVSRTVALLPAARAYAKAEPEAAELVALWNPEVSDTDEDDSWRRRTVTQDPVRQDVALPAASSARTRNR